MIDWHLNGPMVIAVLGLLLNQYVLHKKNIQTLTIMKYRLGMLWKAYLHDHNLPNGDIDD